MQTCTKLGYSYFFFVCNLTHDVSIRVERVGGIMLKVEQRVSRNSEWFKETYCLSLTTSERGLKIKGSVKKTRQIY